MPDLHSLLLPWLLQVEVGVGVLAGHGTGAFNPYGFQPLQPQGQSNRGDRGSITQRGQRCSSGVAFAVPAAFVAP